MQLSSTKLQRRCQEAKKKHSASEADRWCQKAERWRREELRWHRKGNQLRQESEQLLQEMEREADEKMDGLVPPTLAFTWGENDSGQLGLGYSSNEVVPNPTQINAGNTSLVQIECGIWHSVALSSNGEVFTWGFNRSGQLGYRNCKNTNVPTKVKSLSGERIVKIACGNCHTAALTATGKLFAWYVMHYII